VIPQTKNGGYTVNESEMIVAKDMWWVGLVEGVLFILFGIAALFWPGLTLVTLVYLFSAYVLVWGVMEILQSLMSIGKNDTWWLSLLFGGFGLGVGVYLIRHPGVTFTTFVLLIGFVFIVRGVMDIVSGFLGNRTGSSRILSFILGGLGVVAGVVMLRQPVAGGVAFVWIIGLYALIVGPILLALSLEVRRALRDEAVVSVAKVK
jgi:uncharacterized membrane protein HdeD (DUF308 family)